MTYDEIYDEAIRNGSSEMMADMLASRQAPGSNTDRELFQGIGTLRQQLGRHSLDYTIREARKQGYNPNPNDMYIGTLARRPGDPEAFINPTGGKSQIKKILEKRDVPDLTGRVNTNLDRRDPKPDVKMADDLVTKMAHKYQATSEKFSKTDFREVKEMVVAQHAYKGG